MKKAVLISCIFILALTTCIDPYELILDEYESLLVVDGMITDESSSYTIKLTRTFQSEYTPPAMVSQAEVFVEDEEGVIAVFHETEPGIYTSDSSQFTGRIGGTYKLHITTEDGLVYESDPCTMTAVSPIDSIYYEVDSTLFNLGREEEKGIRIYLDASNEEERCKYLRWEYEEVWKFQIPYPVKYRFVGGGNKFEPMIPIENQTCWKQYKSGEVIIHSTADQNISKVSRQSIKFIASGKSDRLRIQYSILVKQYSISQNEYEYWKNLQEVTESGGDIFEKQPFSITGNIHCTNSVNEKVLGYFQVSAVKKIRKYITYNQIYGLDLPFYEYPCERIYSLVRLYGYVFVDYDIVMTQGGIYFEYIYTTPECSDCSLSGDPTKPDFWVDIN